MPNLNTANKDISYIYDRIVRVFSHLNNGLVTGGSGFFVSENGYLLTCCHVVFGILLRDLRKDPEFQKIDGSTELEKIEKYKQSRIQKIEVMMSGGSREKVMLKSYDYYYDVAILKTMKSSGKKLYFELEVNDDLDYLDDVIFCGYPESPGYDNTNYPFAINSGIVSAFPELVVGGEKYKHIQLNSINLGGNSGAPLFKKNNNKVYGLVNGHYLKRLENIAVYNNGQLTKGTREIPLSIAYATGFDLLRNESSTFSKVFLRRAKKEL